MYTPTSDNEEEMFKKHWINIDADNLSIDEIHNMIVDYVSKYTKYISTNKESIVF